MAQFITAEEVKTLAIVQGKVDPAIIKAQFIEVSQEEHIRPVLTQDLYDLIVSENNSGTFTGSNETLLNDYIKPCLAHFVILDIIPMMSVRVSNKGLMINTSETSEAAPREDRSDVMKRYREMGETMKEKMIRYIEDNQSSFTTYNNGSSEKIVTNIAGGIII